MQSLVRLLRNASCHDRLPCGKSGLGDIFPSSTACACNKPDVAHDWLPFIRPFIGPGTVRVFVLFTSSCCLNLLRLEKYSPERLANS